MNIRKQNKKGKGRECRHSHSQKGQPLHKLKEGSNQKAVFPVGCIFKVSGG